jgi:hypothetical protein
MTPCVYPLPLNMVQAIRRSEKICERNKANRLPQDAAPRKRIRGLGPDCIESSPSRVSGLEQADT